MSDFESGDEMKKFADVPEDEVRPIEIKPTGSRPLPAQTGVPPLPAGPSPISVGVAEAEPAMAPLDIEKNLIKKGEYVDLLRKDPTLKQIYIAAGWEQRIFDEDKIDVDLSCFLLDKTEKTRVDGDFVFYNNLSACEGAVRHLGDSRTGAGDGDDESLFIDLNGVPFDVLRIMIVLSIYDEALKGDHLGKIRDVYVRLVNSDDKTEIARLAVDDNDLHDQTGLRAFCLVREGPKWYADVTSQGAKGGLAAIAKSYGIIIKEDTG